MIIIKSKSNTRESSQILFITFLNYKPSEESSENIRELEDEVDDYKQKNLAGKFVITCDRKKPSEMKTQEELAADGGDRALPAHIVQLALSKYGTTLKEDDISSCHYLPKGGIFFSLWNMRPGSPSAALTEAIKTSKDKTKNRLG